MTILMCLLYFVILMNVFFGALTILGRSIEAFEWLLRWAAAHGYRPWMGTLAICVTPIALCALAWLPIKI